MRLYIESSVLTDWLFLDQVSVPSLTRVLGQETLSSHGLVRDILRGKYTDSFFTSTWAISESIHNYLRSYAMFNMLFDNLSFRYYESVRDYSRYKLPKTAFRQLKRDLAVIFQRAQDRKRLTVVSHGSTSGSMNDYLYMGFDARDAEHIVIAVDQLSADAIISKDRDFRDRKAELKKIGLQVLYPSEAIQHLTKRAVPR